MGLPRLIFVSRLVKERPLEEFIKKISGYETGDWYTKYSTTADLLVQIALSIGTLEDVTRKPAQKVTQSSPTVDVLQDIAGGTRVTDNLRKELKY
jgi:hypothetical protein